ncbi:RNA polymerase sigma-70 factor (ECF subfamily) [Streptomyces sp. 3330]|uniref:sigma-70 family RNA polymerase sigma factor n=1 Tax=Streptomyces sp. 3330 TaxID=2817755 RepID=UPI00285E2BAD|nr:sigma-70 family RNA polymerase sigma factor [Streptomyces sp. 3330]MDR6976372.1 RNA polymerase sigma-70 factor (ECF subfamily) [Streptomyces sp. 3330]
MTTHTALPPERFEADRPHLRAVAYRMLGSLSEAEDAVQETWLRATRADVGEVENLSGWLTTVVGRVCLNMLRSRRTRPEVALDAQVTEPVAGQAEGGDPEEEALLADSVGVALLVVLDTLAPAERLAFVLHDLFAVPFDVIAPMIDRTPAGTRQLASRARRRVRGGAAVAPNAPSGPGDTGTPRASAPGRGPAAPASAVDRTRQRQVADAFLAATRGGDFEALLALLHPDVVLTADRFVVPTPEPVTVRGAGPVAEGAMAAAGRARFTGLALLDGGVGLAMAPHGRLRLVLLFTIAEGGITRIDVVADRERLDGIEVAVLDTVGADTMDAEAMDTETMDTETMDADG